MIKYTITITKRYKNVESNGVLVIANLAFLFFFFFPFLCDNDIAIRFKQVMISRILLGSTFHFSG